MFYNSTTTIHSMNLAQREDLWQPHLWHVIFSLAWVNYVYAGPINRL